MQPDPSQPAPGLIREKPTLRTIAQVTGFAVATVSRALADDPRIAAKTRAKVTKAAEQLGYVPNRAARRLRTGRTQVIAVLLNTEHEFLGFTHEFLRGMSDALAGTGYAMSIIPDHPAQDRLGAVKNILRNNLADGIVFTRTECFDPRVRFLLENDFPFVSHGRTEFTIPHPWVDFDNEAFTRHAVAHLVAKGRRKLSMIMPDARFTFAQHLRFGFVSAAREAGIDHHILPDVTLDSDPAQITAALMHERQTAPPDGYICVGEATALMTRACLTDMGATPGVEADVFAKRASPIFDHIRPKIDTVFEDLHATGQAMAQLLLRRMGGDMPKDLHILFGPA
jgi:LacI family transcriptional regulator